MNSTIEGVKPLTRVQGGEVTVEGLAQNVLKTRETHGELLQKYHEVWYNCEHTWVYTHFLGVGMMKCPNDLWMYQQIMTRLRPTTIIETGTYHGASALWFAFLMDMLRIDGGRVFTVDYEAYDLDPVVRHPRITYLHGDSVDPKLVEAITAEIVPGPMLICLDSDHSETHVRRELELYAPLCKVGDWLVVEDTNIGWEDGNTTHNVAFNGDIGRCICGLKFLVMENLREHATPEQVERAISRAKCPHDKSDRGARGGLQDYIDDHPNEWRQDILSERYLLTMNPGGWLERMAECEHGA